jgi:hypothetical protein
MMCGVRKTKAKSYETCNQSDAFEQATAKRSRDVLNACGEQEVDQD